MRRLYSCLRTLPTMFLIVVPFCAAGQTVDSQQPPPAASASPLSRDVQATHFYFASQIPVSSAAHDGTAELLASPACTVSGCTVIADPFDSPADRFPHAMPDRSHFLDYRGGVISSWFQNPVGPAELHWYSVTKIAGDLGFPKTGNSVHGIYQFHAIANNATGWAYGLGADPVTNNEYISDMFSHKMEIHAAGITNVFTSDGTISKPDDVNYDNNYISINPAAYGSASEGVTFHRDYIKYAPPFFGVVATGGVGARSMTLRCTKACDDMSLYTPLIDLTTDVLTGKVTFSSVSFIQRGQVETLTTDFAVPVSLYGPGYYLPAQTNIEGLIFSASVAGADAAATTVLFESGLPVADNRAIRVDGNAVSVSIEKADGSVRTLQEIAELFKGGTVKTKVSGTILVFPASGTDVREHAFSMQAKVLKEIAAPRQPDGLPIATTFAVGTSTPLQIGQMMDLMGPQFNEVTAPTEVGKLIAGMQIITAPLYFSHPPTAFCANTGTASGSGMVGRYIELKNVTKLTVGSRQRYVQTILCSPTKNTLLMGTIGYGSFRVMGYEKAPQPANIYHGADLRRIFDPATSDKTQEVNGPGYGTYAAVDANDTFKIGDDVENTPYPVQNWTKNKTFMDVQDPFATWNGHIERYIGAGLNGAWMAPENMNPPALYMEHGGSKFAPELMHVLGIWGGGITWDELPSESPLQHSSQPYLLFVQRWSSTTQTRLGLFRAGNGDIIFNQGSDGASSFFQFGSGPAANGIKAGSVTAAQFVVEGPAPSVVAGESSGKASSVRVTGTNLAGVITLTTGIGARASGTVAAIRFRGKLGIAPQGCSLMPRNADAASATTTIYTTAPDTAAWSVNTGKTPLEDKTQYVWSYLCM
jgi:hypothetical protein